MRHSAWLKAPGTARHTHGRPPGHRSVKHKGSDDAGRAQAGNGGGGAPMAVRRGVDQIVVSEPGSRPRSIRASLISASVMPGLVVVSSHSNSSWPASNG